MALVYNASWWVREPWGGDGSVVCVWHRVGGRLASISRVMACIVLTCVFQSIRPLADVGVVVRARFFSQSRGENRGEMPPFGTSCDDSAAECAHTNRTKKGLRSCDAGDALRCCRGAIDRGRKRPDGGPPTFGASVDMVVQSHFDILRFFAMCVRWGNRGFVCLVTASAVTTAARALSNRVMRTVPSIGASDTTVRCSRSAADSDLRR